MMGAKSMASKQERPAAASSDYVRFLILAEARSGSTMLKDALKSSPRIRCFSEVFNVVFDGVMYGGVEGYDNNSAEDRALRDRDFRAFLRERIYCRHPDEVEAVGFKMLVFGQAGSFDGLLPHLAEDRQIRVLYLRRRNALKRLVSLKLAEATGVWADLPKPGLTPAIVLRAARRPLRAATKFPRLLQLAKSRPKVVRPQVSVSEEELFGAIIGARQNAAHYHDLFRDHQMLTLFYEDLVEQRDETFRQAQEFLGVEPGPLTVRLIKQNPEPLPELLSNYDELRTAYRYSKHAWMFD